MSRPRYWWYTNVERVVRSYPLLRMLRENKRAVRVVADYSGMPRGGGGARTTEAAAVRSLTRQEEEDLEAVEQAIEDIGRQADGKEVLLVAEYYHWRRVGNLDAVADALHMSRRTAERKNRRFIYAVARKLGYV